MAEIFRLADAYAASGHDVLLEGLLLSSEEQRSVALATKHELHMLCLDTLLDRRVRNLIARRRASRRSWSAIARTTERQQEGIEQACRRLRRCAKVEVLGFDTALLRARQLLGLERIELVA
jgi:hypothetical protein